jgi:murein DD-endopeptidase MepM/ murein hydrolase activator NlpD
MLFVYKLRLFMALVTGPLARRTAAVLLTAALVAGWPLPAQASQMPPQLPSEQEMARLFRTLDSALVKVRGARAALDQLVADYERAQDELTHIIGEVAAAHSRLEALEAELQAARANINKRAAWAYRAEPLGLLDALLGSRSFPQFLSAFSLVKATLKADADIVVRITELTADAAKVRAEVDERRSQQNQVVADLGRRQRQMENSLAALRTEYNKVQAQIDERKSGFAFPVRAPYSYTDSWGAPRMEGTSFYHRHEGTDIFALRGTAVVAVVDGVVERVGTAVLGGIKLWLRSPGDDWTYFYAHLSGYASGITDGVRVRKGQVLGFIGNTGNAVGTPPHLHFETHIPGGAPINPYPILRRVDPLAR